MLLSRLCVGTYPEASLHTACQETFGYSHLSLLIHCGLNLAQRVKLVSANCSPLNKKERKKERKKHRQGMNGQTI